MQRPSGIDFAFAGSPDIKLALQGAFFPFIRAAKRQEFHPVNWIDFRNGRQSNPMSSSPKIQEGFYELPMATFRSFGTQKSLLKNARTGFLQQLHHLSAS